MWRHVRVYSLLVHCIPRRTVHNTKVAGLDKESFILLATQYTPFMRDVFKPEVQHLEAGKVIMSLPFKPELVGKSTPPACLHGGVVAAMFDHVGGFCAWSALDTSRKTVSTIDLRVDYLLPAPCEEIYFDAMVVSKTNRLVRVDVECWDNQREKKIAVARGLFNIYDSKTDISELIASYTNEESA